MHQITVAPGITRVLLNPESTETFTPVVFRDEEGDYLQLAACTFSPRPVWRLTGQGESGEVKQTANGEVVSFDSGERVQAGTAYSAMLRFTYPGTPVLTGLGAHEDGIFDYAGRSELLHEHNMKIPIPFLLSSDGWGILIEAGCAMTYRGSGSGFTFTLDAARAVTFVVIRGRNCAEVLRLLSDLTGKPALLPKWAYGYIQSKERYHSAEELLTVAREFRSRGVGLDGIVLDWVNDLSYTVLKRSVHELTYQYTEGAELANTIRAVILP